MKHLLDSTPEALAGDLKARGQPAYRTRQILDWAWRKGAPDFAAMTNLPRGLRDELAAETVVRAGRVAARSDAADGVVKLLLAWADGEQIETALIPAQRRATACVSTQAGCPVGCSFCASGADGLRRNLSAGEIVEQVLWLQDAAERAVTHVVFMGMGEPLLNYDATVAAVRALTDPRRGGLSARRVTVSTVGLPREIRRLAREDLPITLAISLHAPTDALRRELIPWPGLPPLAEVIGAAQAFFQARKREVTLEYVLLGGVNDTNVCAEGLSRLAHQLRCNVNLIPYNPVSALPYRRPGRQAVRAFADRLQRRGVNVQVRRSRGADANAACGQLRRRRSPT